MRGRLLLLCAGLTGTLHATLMGQVQADPPWMAARAAAIARLRTGELVRVTVRNADRRVGLALGMEGTALVMGLERATESDLFRVPVTDVDTLWVFGPATGRGARIGALTGALAAAIAVAVFCEKLSETESRCDDPPAYVVVSMPFGALLGALFGSIIGSTTSTWHRRYP